MKSPSKKEKAALGLSAGINVVLLILWWQRASADGSEGQNVSREFKTVEFAGVAGGAGAKKAPPAERPFKSEMITWPSSLQLRYALFADWYPGIKIYPTAAGDLEMTAEEVTALEARLNEGLEQLRAVERTAVKPLEGGIAGVKAENLAVLRKPVLEALARDIPGIVGPMRGGILNRSLEREKWFGDSVDRIEVTVTEAGGPASLETIMYFKNGEERKSRQRIDASGLAFHVAAHRFGHLLDLKQLSEKLRDAGYESGPPLEFTPPPGSNPASAGAAQWSMTEKWTP